jgi:hypothetical protein
MTRNKIKIVSILLITLMYYVFFFDFKFVFSEGLRLRPLNYQLSENCIIVRGQAVTGPEVRVVEGAEFLASSLTSPQPENLNVNEIEMVGKSIYGTFLKYPDYYACDWLIYGEVIGTTDMYEIVESGTIPIFECNKLYPVVTLYQFSALELIMFDKFPIGLLVALLMRYLPFTLMILFIIFQVRANLNRHSL